MQTLAEILRHDGRALVVPDGPILTYAALSAEVERVAELLAGAGLERGRPVALIMPNGLEFLACFLAVVRAGGVAAPLNPAYSAGEFRFFLEDADAQLAIVPPGFEVELSVPVIEARRDVERVVLARGGRELTERRNVPAPEAEDIALFLHTSGTTSRPKGVPLTHANLVASLGNIQRTYDLAADDVALCVMPLFHVHGLIGVALSTLGSGGCVVVPPRFSASAFWPVQRATGATWYSAVPTIHQVLLARTDDDGAPKSSFRFIRSCSAALAPVVLEALESRFGAPVLEAYGMTEASHQMASNLPPPAERVAGTVGVGAGVEIAIMDAAGSLLPAGERGEVVIRGPNVTKGYRNNPEANAEAFTDGWFRTGDQGFLALDGRLTLTGRLKELINRGGEKISPLEVDAVLLAHPAVAEAVCFGVSDPKYGEAVHAAVVLSADVTEEELQCFCRERLAAFKVPDRIHVTDSLPRTATGKVQRRHVAAAFTP